MIRCNRLVWVVVVAIAAPLAAQVSNLATRERIALPDPPADHVLDLAELFKRHPERREAISQRLLALQSDHDLPVYVAIYGTILDSSLPRRARRLYDRWIGPDRDGIVVVYEADSRQAEIVTPGGHDGGAAAESGRESRLPDYRLIPILAELRVTLEGVDNRLDYLDCTVEILTEGLDGLLGAQARESGHGGTLNFALIALVVGVVIALLGYFGNRRLRAVEKRTRARFYFPDVRVGTRLGAPYSGGRQSVVDFSRRGPRDS